MHKANTVTVDEALELLKKAKQEVGGDAYLILSLSGSEIEDRNVEGLKVICDNDSRYVEVRASLRII